MPNAYKVRLYKNNSKSLNYIKISHLSHFIITGVRVQLEKLAEEIFCTIIIIIPLGCIWQIMLVKYIKVLLNR